MTVLDLLTPTKSRNFTFYDRCAILLDPDEMSAQRVRISLTILGSPLSRSVNFKYPYSKEFYGYAQGFWLNTLVEEFPINYSNQYIWDYWNQHSTLAYQFTNVLQRLTKFFVSTIDFETFLLVAGSPITTELATARTEVSSLTSEGFTVETTSPITDSNPANDTLNTFVHPFDLIRFKFSFGTVFAVGIDSWNLGTTFSGTTPPPYPAEVPYPTENPNGITPFPTPGGNNPDEPYGVNPPESSPLDPRLDPNDFSNAPDPLPPSGTINLQGWSIPAIAGFQSAAFAVGCPAGSLAESIFTLAGVQNAVNLGVKPIRVDAQGRASGADVLAAFPGFIFGDHTFGAGPACGVTGTF